MSSAVLSGHLQTTEGMSDYSHKVAERDRTLFIYSWCFKCIWHKNTFVLQVEKVGKGGEKSSVQPNFLIHDCECENW